MGKKNRGTVVITRKDKRLHKGLHLFAFALTGGLSAPVTAAKAATNAGYNARTRKLAAESQDTGPSQDDRDWARDRLAEFRRDHVPASKEYKAAHGAG